MRPALQAALFARNTLEDLIRAGVAPGLIGYWELRTAYLSGQDLAPVIGRYSLRKGTATVGDAAEPTVGEGYTTFANDYFLDLAAVAVDVTQPWTVYMYLRCGSGAGYVVKVSGSSGYWGAYRVNDNSMALYAQDPAAAYHNTGNLAVNITDSVCLAMTWDGTTHTLRRLDTGASVAATGGSATGSGEFKVGGTAPELYSPNVAIFQACHSLDQQRLVGEWIRNRGAALMPPFDWQAATGNLVAFDGDSLTSWDIYPPLVRSGLTGSWDKVNHGLAGATWDSMTADASSLAIYYGPLRANNILCVLCGTNDYAYAASVTYPKVVAYCQARQAEGWKVVIGSVPPRSDATEAQETQRGLLNAEITDHWATFADAIADFSADPYIGTGTFITQPTYWTNFSHYSTTGFTLLATYFETAVESLL